MKKTFAGFIPQTLPWPRRAGPAGRRPLHPLRKAAPAHPRGELTGTVTVWSWDLANTLCQSRPRIFSSCPWGGVPVREMGTSQVYSKLTTCLQSGIGLPGVVTIEGEQMAKFGSKFPANFTTSPAGFNAADYLDVQDRRGHRGRQAARLALGFRPLRPVLPYRPVRAGRR